MQSFKQYLTEARKLPPNHAPWHIMDEMQLQAFMINVQPEWNKDWTRHPDGSCSSTKKQTIISDDILVETHDGGWGLPFPIRNCRNITIMSPRLTSLKGFPSRVQSGQNVKIICSNLETFEDLVVSNLSIFQINCPKLKQFNPTVSWIRSLVIDRCDFDFNDIVKNVKHITTSIRFSAADANTVKQLNKGILKFIKINGKPHLHLVNDNIQHIKLEDALTLYNRHVDDEGMNIIAMQELLFKNDLDQFAKL